MNSRRRGWPHPNETKKPDDAPLFDQLAPWPRVNGRTKHLETFPDGQQECANVATARSIAPASRMLTGLTSTRSDGATA
jgi:hypothetical protein